MRELLEVSSNQRIESRDQQRPEVAQTLFSQQCSRRKAVKEGRQLQFRCIAPIPSSERRSNGLPDAELARLSGCIKTSGFGATLSLYEAFVVVVIYIYICPPPHELPLLLCLKKSVNKVKCVFLTFRATRNLFWRCITLILSN